MARRTYYSRAEDVDMIEYWERMVKNNEDEGLVPFGTKIWEKFRNDGYSNRAADNLSSHFRKQVYKNFWEWWEVPVERIMSLLMGFGGDISSEKNSIELHLRITITLNSDGSVKKWERKTKKINAKESPESQKRGKTYIPNRAGASESRNGSSSSKRRILTPVVLEIQGSSSSSQSSASDNEMMEDVPRNNKRLQRNGIISPIRTISSQDEVSDPMADPNEHNYTKEIDDIKRQARVRHSIREAKGLPPILATAKKVTFDDVFPDVSFHEGMLDISPVIEDIEVFFHGNTESDAGTNNVIDRLGNADSNELQEGQGLNIESVKCSSENISSSNKIPVEKVTSNVRDKAIKALFERLTEIYHSLDEYLMSELHKREEEIFNEHMPQAEYLEAVAKLAETKIKNLQGLADPFVPIHVNSETIRLIEHKHENVEINVRKQAAQNIMKNMAANIPSEQLDFIRQTVEQQEAFILLTVKNKDEYEDRMTHLREYIAEEIKALKE